MWSRTLGGPDGDVVTSVQQTRDGGYILAGATGSVGAGGPNAWLIKTDDSGNEVWSRTFGGDTAAADARQVSGGYVLIATAVSDTNSNLDAWLMRTDDSGKVLWSRAFGGPKLDEAWTVRQTTDGGYIVAGRTLSFGAGMTDAWLIKTDSKGMVASQP
jgi:hypothetical protein